MKTNAHNGQGRNSGSMLLGVIVVICMAATVAVGLICLIRVIKLAPQPRPDNDDDGSTNQPSITMQRVELPPMSMPLRYVMPTNAPVVQSSVDLVNWQDWRVDAGIAMREFSKTSNVGFFRLKQ